MWQDSLHTDTLITGGSGTMQSLSADVVTILFSRTVVFTLV